jgi:hypothetical protein
VSNILPRCPHASKRASPTMKCGASRSSQPRRTLRESQRPRLMSRRRHDGKRAVNATPSETSTASARPGSANLREVGAFICADERRVKAVAALLRAHSPGVVESKVAGLSMGTTIPHGSRIRIGPGTDACTSGTVVAFIAGGKSIVHRVRWRGRLGRARAFLITQGDALMLPDIPVEIEAVLGAVVAVESGGVSHPPGAKPMAPRRDRALSFVVFAGSVVLLEVHPRLARWFLSKLGAAESRYAWTTALLY